MWPPVPRSTSLRPNDLQQFTTPPKLMSSTRSYSSRGVSRKSPACPTPALLTTMSGTPCSALTCSANRSTASASATSRVYACATPPRAAIWAAVSLTPASSMSLITSSAPSRANSRAVARPIPLPAPVTETSVSPKYSRRRPTCARSSDRLAGFPSRKSTNSCTDRAIVDGCDIGDQWPAWMSRRHNRGTHLWVSCVYVRADELILRVDDDLDGHVDDSGRFWRTPSRGSSWRGRPSGCWRRRSCTSPSGAAWSAGMPSRTFSIRVT